MNIFRVKTGYPTERANVTARQKDIQDMWQKVREKAADRRSRLENAVGHQIFVNGSKTLLAWVESVKDELNSLGTAKDVATAEALLKNHNELGEDIKAHQPE